MIRRVLIALSLSLVACKEPATTAGSRDIALPEKICNTKVEQIAFRPQNFSELRGKYNPPKVLMRRDDIEIVLDATWSTNSLLFNVPEGLQTGVYSLGLTNQGQASAAELQGTVRVVTNPVIEEVVHGRWCGSAAVESELLFRVTHLEDDTAVVLDGAVIGTTTTKVERYPELDSLKLRVLGGQFAQGASFDLVLTNAPGCSARKAQAVQVTGTPQPTEFKVGPTLRDGRTVPPGSKISVQVKGESITSGTSIAIAGFAPLTARNTDVPGVVEAEFAAMNPGTYTLTARNGGCVADVPGNVTVSAELPIAIQAVNPSAVTTFGDHYLDLTVALSEAVPDGAKLRFFADVNPSPLATDWQPLLVDGALNQERTMWRVYTPAFTSPESTALDLRVEASMSDADPALPGVEGFSTRGLAVIGSSTLAPQELRQDAAMRLVWKDRDHARVGERVVIYGCFGQDVQAELVAMDGLLGSVDEPTLASLTTRGVIAAEPWAADKYRCLRLRSDKVSRMLEVEIPPEVTPGAYRLRLRDSRPGVEGAEAQPIVADDLYPFVVYPDTPTASAFNFARDGAEQNLRMSVGRKLAASTLASDSGGRKYLYVMGGDSSGTPSSSPMALGSVSLTYDYASVSPAHELYDFRSAALTAEVTEPGNVAATYAMSALADGPQVYLIGGTATGAELDTTAEIRRARVRESLLDGSSTAGQLTGFTKVGRLQEGTEEKKSFGQTVAMLRNGEFGNFARRAVVVRGIKAFGTPFLPSSVVFSGALPSTGLGSLDQVSTLNAIARTQAFGTAYQTRMDAVEVAFGFAAPVDDGEPSMSERITDAESRFHVAQRIDGALSNLTHAELAFDGLAQTPGQTLPIDLPEAGVGVVTAGTRSFAFGGIRFGYNNSPATDNDFQFSELRYSTASALDLVRALDAPVAVLTAKLLERRAYMATVQLAPFAYVVGGLVCANDDADPLNASECDEREASSSVEFTRID